MIKVLVVSKHPHDSIEAETCSIIKKEGFEIVNSWKNSLSKSDLEKIDLVISVGGDGTALSASHYLLDKPLLAVNSSPKTSVGALTTLTLENLSKKLEEIKENKHKLENLERIQVFVDNKPLDHLALNDVFIANEKAYLISKYKIKFKSLEETQLSSGLIFSTGTGSTAWFKSAFGIPFSPQSKFIKMIVREPYISKLHTPDILNCEIKDNEEISITVLAPSILAIDSIREYPLSVNSKVTIKISSNPLKRII